MRRTARRHLRSKTEGSSRWTKPWSNGRAAARKGTAIDGSEPSSYEGLVAHQLSNVPDIDAVYVWDDDGFVHVYSVVSDFSYALYKKLQSRERKIEKEFPEMIFDFHVRAHQGRKPDQAVPLGARAVFVR
jgi:hypothetical protein